MDLLLELLARAASAVLELVLTLLFALVSLVIVYLMGMAMLEAIARTTLGS